MNIEIPLPTSLPRKLRHGWAAICGGCLVFAGLTYTPIDAQEVQFNSLPGVNKTADQTFRPGNGNVMSAGYTEPASSPLNGAARRARISAQYQLQRLNCEQFERALVSCWLENPAAEAIDSGRQVRVWMNELSENTAMWIDRDSGTISLEGDRQLAAAWQSAVATIDQLAFAPGNSTIRVLPLNKLSPATVRQVAYVATAGQDPELPQQDDTVQRPVPIRPGQGEMPTIVTQNEDAQGQALTGTVTIQVFEEANLIILRGPKEDVAIVEKAIREIYQTAGVLQPKIERVPLANSDPSTTADQVQTVYDAIYANSQGSASITAIQEPRGLLVIGREEAIKTIKDIVTQFDVAATDRTIIFKAFQLKFMSAEDAKQRVDEYFGQATQAPLATPPFSLPVVTIADYRSNQLIVKASQNYIDQVAELLNQLDTEETGALKTVRIFKLRNTVASDIATVLQNSLNGQQPNAGAGYTPTGQQNQFGGGGVFQQNNLQTQPGRSTLNSTALQLMTIDRNGNQVKSGILFDVRVNADNSSNSLVVTAPTSSMQLIATLIEQLDQIPNAETQIKVFQIMNGDAQVLLTMLQNLFASAQQAGGQFGAFGAAGQGQSNLSQLPLQNASATDGQTLVNLRLALDTRTNSIIVSGPVGDLEVVEDLLTRLDEEDLNLRDIFVYRLSNNAVLDVAESLNTWLDERENLLTADPSYANLIVQNRRKITVTPETVSNSLIVSATPQFMPEILGVIRALDRRPPVLKVKVMIAEVNLTMIEEFGIEMGVQDALLFDRGLSNIRYPFNQSLIGNDNTAASLATRNNLAGQALSNLSVGRINNDLGYGGLVLSAGNESINLLLRALQNKNCLRVLSKPEIYTIENQQARIQVGARAPYVTGVTQTNFGVQNNIELQDVGIILQVTPRVSPDGMIVMKLDATKSQLGAEEDGVVVFVPNTGDPLRQPQILTTTAQTTIMARSGQTVAFAGLVQETKSRSRRQTPILGDLPLIGPLFRFDSENSNRNELLIIMTPYIVNGDEDLDAHNQEAMDRMHWCLCDVAEIYGNTNYDQPPHYTTPEIFYPDEDPSGVMPQQPEQPGADSAPKMPQSQTLPSSSAQEKPNAGIKRNGLFSLKKPQRDN